MKLTIEQWQALFQEQETSGLSQAEFCISKGISQKSFSCRKYRDSIRIKKSHDPTKKLAHVLTSQRQSQFVKVKPVSSRIITLESKDVGSILKLRFPKGIEIDFPCSELKSVISILTGGME